MGAFPRSRVPHAFKGMGREHYKNTIKDRPHARNGNAVNSIARKRPTKTLVLCYQLKAILGSWHSGNGGKSTIVCGTISQRAISRQLYVLEFLVRRTVCDEPRGETSVCRTDDVKH
jgi:hypothetical protein